MRDEGAGRFGFSCGLSPWLQDDCLLAASLMVFTLCVHILRVSFILRTPTILDQGGREDPLKEGIATHSSILAWRIPGTEEPSGLHSMELQRVGHN